MNNINLEFEIKHRIETGIGVRHLLTLFYLSFWLIKGIHPFNLWIFAGLYFIDAILSFFIVSVRERIINEMKRR